MYPNFSFVFEEDSDILSDDESEESETNQVLNNIKVVKEMSESEEINLLDLSRFTFQNNKYPNLPEFNLKFEDRDVVEFSSQLLLNLDLTVNIDGLLRDRSVKFDQKISYATKEANRFKNLIYNKNGYLNEESNFFELDKKDLIENSNSVILRNSRIVLFWRGLNLSNIDVKKIISLGLTFMLDLISEAELYYKIRSIIPKGIYEISVKHERNSYVIIGIEEPIFSA